MSIKNNIPLRFDMNTIRTNIMLFSSWSQRGNTVTAAEERCRYGQQDFDI